MHGTAGVPPLDLSETGSHSWAVSRLAGGPLRAILIRGAASGVDILTKWRMPRWHGLHLERRDDGSPRAGDGHRTDRMGRLHSGAGARAPVRRLPRPGSPRLLPGGLGGGAGGLRRWPGGGARRGGRPAGGMHRIGIGRNVDLLGAVSAATSVSIVCATGIYKALRPPELADASPEKLAALFADELTVGIEDTGVRSGFIKLATSDSGPTEEETTIHRAGAMAAVETGAAIALHSPQAGALRTVLRTLEGEGFGPARLVWVHAQESSLADNLEIASRGVTISLDAIGTSNDGEMLDRIEALAEAGGQVVLSSDNTFVVHPPELAYERDITYLDRRFAEMVEARLRRRFLGRGAAGQRAARLRASPRRGPVTSDARM